LTTAHSDFPAAAVPTVSNPRMNSIARDVSGEFLLELVGIFLADVTIRVDRLAIAVAARDGKEVYTLSHSLKGSAASLGVLRLQAHAARMEHHLTREDWDGCGRTLERLVSEFAHVREVLTGMQQRVSMRPWAQK
jgi:HPt (histidine-containing phosphotransfer) domain-containing protein